MQSDPGSPKIYGCCRLLQPLYGSGNNRVKRGFVTAYPYSCYRLDLSGGSKGRSKSSPKDARGPLEEQPLLCKVCSAAITQKKETVSKNGLHEHVFFNPAGVTFEVRCFQRAPGCFIQGDPRTEFTWFHGYSWQYALCSSCLTHLGWRFNSNQDSFFGLIATRLID